MNLNVASGATVTLPAASGTGNVYRFFVQTTVTSNNYVIQVASGDDTMSGIAVVANDSDNTASIFETAADSDTITLDGTTKGGILGGQVELQDVASGKFRVLINQAATGTEATPFSAAVS
jgi:type 1 fimbria pilin